jgi:hypothetical protein
MADVGGAGKGPTSERLNNDTVDLVDELTGIRGLHSLPAMVVGLVLGFVIFIAVAVALGAIWFGLLELQHPTGPLAAAIGLGWFGGSLAITGILLQRVLRRVNAFLRRRNLPALY